MYPVGKKYLDAVQNCNRSFYYAGIIVTKDGMQFPFTNKDILKGSGYLINQCCGDSEIEIGTVYAAEFGITLYSDIDRYSLEGATISVSFFLKLEDGMYEEVPLGIFEISEANRKIHYLEIKAYDYMLRFDKNFNNVVSSGTPYDLISLACEFCDVEFAHTQEEMNLWNNADKLLGIYAENDIETWRDVLYYVAQVLGCFCTINRAGKLELRKYGNVPVMDISSKHRFSSSYSDFVTKYTAVYSTNLLTQKTEYYALEEDTGLTMNLGSNPMIQYGLEETRKEILTNVLNDISHISYVPFEASTIGNPALDLGDVITFSGGHADEKQITCITKYEYRINGKHTLKCVGKNPRMAQAKSKSDKNIAGLLNSIEAGKIAVYSFINASPYTIGETDTEIINMEFASADNTDAQFQASILIDVSAKEVEKVGKVTGTITIPDETQENGVSEQEEEFKLSWQDDGKAIATVTYIFNNHAMTFIPKQSWHSGKHILSLYYPLNGMEGNSLNTFSVRIRIEGGTGNVERGEAIATISGQGLSANSAWDGRIEVSDEIQMYSLQTGLEVTTLKDETGVSTEIVRKHGFMDVISGFRLGGFGLADFSDVIQLNPVVVSHSIDVADREMMSFDRYFVVSETMFELQKTYVFEALEQEIDEGILGSIMIDFSQFESVSTAEIIVVREIENVKYLLSDEKGQFYRVVIDEEDTETLEQIDAEEVNAEVFLNHGFENVVSSELLTALENPTIWYWKHQEGALPEITVQVKATPKAQVVYCENVLLNDNTIVGVESVEIDASGEVLFAFSFDGGNTWKAYTESTWVILSEENSGMSKAAVEAVSTDAWNDMITERQYRIRFTLFADSYLNSIKIHYLN